MSHADQDLAAGEFLENRSAKLQSYSPLPPRETLAEGESAAEVQTPPPPFSSTPPSTPTHAPPPPSSSPLQQYPWRRISG